MTFADFKVVEIVRRGNFNRTGSLFRVGMLIGNNLFIQSISLIYRDTANLFLPGTGTGG